MHFEINIIKDKISEDYFIIKDNTNDKINIVTDSILDIVDNIDESIIKELREKKRQQKERNNK